MPTFPQTMEVVPTQELVPIRTEGRQVPTLDIVRPVRAIAITHPDGDATPGRTRAITGEPHRVAVIPIHGGLTEILLIGTRNEVPEPQGLDRLVHTPVSLVGAARQAALEPDIRITIALLLLPDSTPIIVVHAHLMEAHLPG